MLLTLCHKKEMLSRGSRRIERLVAGDMVAEKADFEMFLKDAQLNQLLDSWLCSFICGSERRCPRRFQMVLTCF